MRLLVLTYRLPWHTYTADRYTVRHFIEYFSKRHSVVLAAFAGSREEAEKAEGLRRLCHRVEAVMHPPWVAYARALRGLASQVPLSVWLYSSRAMQGSVRRIVASGEVDLAFVYHLRMAQYLAGVDTIPRCLALQPVQTLNLERFKQHARHPLWKLIYTIEHHRMACYERAVAARFDRCLLISEKDRLAIDPRRELDNVFFSPHGLDAEYFIPGERSEKEPASLIFHGSMRYQANADAVRFFAEQIYPLVKQELPQVKLYVVGYEPPPSVRALAADPSIVVTGGVEDVRPYLNRAQVAIDPLRIGAGLQNKVLESMAMALPVVATSLANEGIGATDGEELLLADEPAEFADKVIVLFKDEALRRRLGAKARRFVEERWSWETYYRPLEMLFEELVAVRRETRKAS